MNRFAFVALFLVPAVRSEVVCPENVVCTSTLKQTSCPEGTYFREKVKSNNCCPGCIELNDYGQRCNDDKECAPGLHCVFPPEGSSIRRCQFDERQGCEYYKRTNDIWISTRYWEPKCLPNGGYAEKQCKGEKLSGKCFCTNERGERIFGEASWMKASNMACACSRLVENIRKTRKDISLHCDDEGNFEPLQCDNRICWCANERTGLPYTPIVPETMMWSLPCMEEKKVGSQYLRRCDSLHVQAERVSQILKNHGMKTLVLPIANCNYDGSYARYQTVGNKRYCSYRNLKKLTTAGEGIKDCNCLYDKFVAEFITGSGFIFECDDVGSYKFHQTQGNMKFKVDLDGCPFDFQEINT